MLKLYTTSLRSKIFLGFTVILFIMFIATLWSIYNFYQFNERIKLTMQENYSSIIAADNMGRTLDDQLHAILVIFNQDFETGDNLFQKSRDEFYFWYRRARISAYTINEKSILDTLNYEYDKFISDYYNIDYKVLAQKNFMSIVDRIKTLKSRSNRILEINHSLLDKAIESVKEISETATIFIILILIGAVVVSIIFGSRFSNYIVRPIANLRKSVSNIADHNFDARIELDENSDELVALADDFNRMGEKLKQYEQLNLNKILYEKKKSELIIENMNEPVIMVDKNLNILLSNKAFSDTFTHSMEYEKMMKMILSLFSSGNVNLEVQEKDRNIYNKNDILSYRTQDSIKYYKIIAAKLEIPNSEKEGMVVVFNDITKYQELDRMKSEFIAKVSHELKTPLTSIGLALGIMEEGVTGSINEKQSELIVSMKEDYERLTKLVYDILELTKLEAGISKIKFEIFDARKLIDYIQKKYSNLAKEKNISLEIFEHIPNLKINGSYNHLLSALDNLVDNSLKFTPANGTIKVDFSYVTGNLLIEISDTGIGISPENLKKIFDKFIQIDNSSPGSLGLGLSIAKEIIEFHNGEIKAFSQLGSGSTFQIKIPAIT